MNQHIDMTHVPIMASDGAGGLRPLRFDPDGCSIGPEVPENLLTRWKMMLANNAAAQSRLHASYERTYKSQAACLRVLTGLLEDAGGIAEDLRDLTNLFDMALNSEHVDGKLAEALRLVVGSIMTMADRLNSLEEQAEAARKRHFL